MSDQLQTSLQETFAVLLWQLQLGRAWQAVGEACPSVGYVIPEAVCVGMPGSFPMSRRSACLFPSFCLHCLCPASRSCCFSSMFVYFAFFVFLLPLLAFFTSPVLLAFEICVSAQTRIEQYSY